MVYKTRSGVVLVEICGVSFLVATREIWDGFSKIRPLSGRDKFIWKLLDNGSEWSIICSIVSKFSRSGKDETEQRLRALCDSLVNDGFLIEVPDEGNSHDEG